MHSLNYFGGGWTRFRAYTSNHRLDWCADKSGWDWNSPGWVYDVCKKLRKRLTINSSPEWEEVLDRLYFDAYECSKVILPDGTVLEQLSAGLMKSGLVATISDNGIAQIALHKYAEMKTSAPRTRILATGDDTIQQTPRCVEDYVRALQQGGCVVKEFHRGSDFMGFELTEGGVYPKYFAKHIKTLIIQKDQFLAETLEGYLRIYVFDERYFRFFEQLALNLGYSMPSRQYFLYHANNPDVLEEYSSIARPSFGDRVVGGGVCM